MQTVHIDYPGAKPDFNGASQLARRIAMERNIREPTIVSWHQHSNRRVSSYYDGANPDSWCEKYGEGNGGELEVKVGNEYDFVMTDSEGYETLGKLPLRNLSDGAGNHYLCYTPIQGMLDKKPSPDACTYLDEWTADQF